MVRMAYTHCFLHTNSTHQFYTPILHTKSTHQFHTPIPHTNSTHQFHTPIPHTNPTHQFYTPTTVQIIVFNHTSYLDSVVMMHLFAPSGVSKASNAHLPLVGPVIRSFQNIYVPEGGGTPGGGWDGKPRMNLATLIAQRYNEKQSKYAGTQPQLLIVMMQTIQCGDMAFPHIGQRMHATRRCAWPPKAPVVTTAASCSSKPAHLSAACLCCRSCFGTTCGGTTLHGPSSQSGGTWYEHAC